jgi:hypothetical protein
MVWAVIIGVIVLLIAIALQTWVMEVFEDGSHFLYFVGGFLVLFVAAVGLCFWLLPSINGGSNVGQLVQTWVNPDLRAKADQGDNLPLLK